MFRPIRRVRQTLSAEATEAILRDGSFGTLALAGDDGFPYAVPLNYVWHRSRIFFHCAKSGHKLDAIQRCDKVSFSVVTQDTVVPETLTTHFRSAVVFGRARILTDAEEIADAMYALSKKYAPALSDARIESAMRSEAPALCVVCITVEHMSGKEAIELVKQREN